MKTLHLQRSHPDGRVFYYHQVHGVVIPPEPGLLIVEMGSWRDDPSYLQNPTPESKTQITLQYTENVEDVIPTLLERVVALPGWQGQIVEM